MSRLRRAQQAARKKSAAPFPWRSLRYPCLALALATAFLFAPITQHPFVNYDDAAYILDNPHIQQGLTWNTVSWAFSHFYEANWHPLTWLLHALDFQLYGDNAGGHHLTSLFLHLANVLLLFLLLARATGFVARSLLVAALFALHPMNVESVAWAAELKNVLCTLFFLLALGAYGWYAQKPSGRRYGAVALLYALALASKPMAITLPFVLLLVDYWPLGRMAAWTEPSAILSVPQKPFGILVLEKLPLLPLCLASAMVTYFGQQSAGAERMITLSAPVRLENAVYSYAVYLWKAFWPSGLVPFYPHPGASLDPWKPAAAALFLIMISVMVWRASRQHAYLLTGWLWYLGTLVPVIGLVQVGRQARADRYAYIPLIGIFLMAVWGLADVAEQKKWTQTSRRVAALAPLAVLALLAWRQVSFWENSYELWTHTLAVTTDNPVGEHNMGTELLRRERPQEALPHLIRATQLNPQDMVSAINLGAVLAAIGRHKDAVKQFETVVAQSSDSRLLLPAYQNLSREYRMLGDSAKAEESYRQFLRIQGAHDAPDGVAAKYGTLMIGKQ